MEYVDRLQPSQYQSRWLQCSCSKSRRFGFLRTGKFTLTEDKCRHPPGGATALLAVTLPNVYSQGWFYVGDIAAASCIMLVWAMFINNIGDRRYPSVYWSTTA